MKTILSILLILSVCLTSAFAKESLDAGDIYLGLTPAARLMYVAAAMDGLRAGDFVMMPEGVKSAERYRDNVHQVLGTAAAEPVMNAVATFYQDKENRRIGIATAICIVSGQLSGAPTETVKGWVDFWRVVAHETKKQSVAQSEKRTSTR